MEISFKRISTFSCLGFLIVMAVACASSGCVTVENDVNVDCGDDGDDGDTTVVVVIPPGEAQPTEPTPDPTEPDGPLVPMSAPIISVTSLPNNVLVNGTVTAYRLTITARAEADVFVKKLSFAMDVASASPSVYLSHPRLRVVGTGTDLAASADTYVVGPENCGDDIDAPTYPCYRIVLDEPVAVEAGTSVTLELRVTVNGPLATGDMMTCFPYLYAAGPQQGILVGDGLDLLIKDGNEDAHLWSNDGIWFYNGDALAFPAVAQTLTRL